MTKWADILPEIVSMIAKELNFYEDFVNFVGVCGSWRSAVTEDRSFTHPVASRFPYLMLGKSKLEEERDLYDFFLFSNNADGGMIHKLQLAEGRKLKHCVSTQGWLLTIGKGKLSAKLFHPLSGTQINLPALYYYVFLEEDLRFMHKELMRKVVFTSSDPFDESFRVIVIWGVSIGVCSPKDVSWKHTDSTGYGRPFDIMYHNARKRLYVSSIAGIILHCDISDIYKESEKRDVEGLDLREDALLLALHVFGPGPPGALCRLSSLPRGPWSPCAYVLEWNHDSLLVVAREYYGEGDEGFEQYGPYTTRRFQAFVLGLEDCKWTKLESLGDKAVFVGFNSSFFVNASTDDGCSVVRGNCIYFTDDRYLDKGRRDNREEDGQDMGVYHVADDIVRPLFNHQKEAISHVRPPLWLETSRVPPTKKNQS